MKRGLKFIERFVCRCGLTLEQDPASGAWVLVGDAPAGNGHRRYFRIVES